MNIFQTLTPVTYGLLILMWLYILAFYIKRLRQKKIVGDLTITLLIILAIEAFRTLFESVYFGTWYTSLQGYLPSALHAFLVRPEMVFIPKVLNVLAAFLIILILIRRWIPQEERHHADLKKTIDEQTQRLIQSNQDLQKEIIKRTIAEEELRKHRDYLENLVKERTKEITAVNDELKREVDAHREAERLLKNSNVELNQIFNCAADGMRVISKDHGILRVNETFLNITGLTAEEAEEKKCFDIFKGPNCETDNCLLQRVLNGEEFIEVEFEKDQPDGKRIPVVLTGTPYKDAYGRIIGVIENIRDISSIKAVEKTIREERDLFVEGYVVVFKWSSDEGWPVEYVSPNVSKILGYTADDFISKKIRYADLISDLDLDRVKNAKTEAFQTGKDHFEHAPYRVIHKNGKTIWLMDHTRFVRSDEEPAYFYGYIIDISSFKEAEDKLEQHAHLAHTGRLTALGEMASGMAHELNQPMTVIRLAADGLKAYFSDNHIGSVEAESVDDMLTQVKRATNIIKNMRTFSRVTSGPLQPVDITESVDIALSFFREQFRIHQIKLNQTFTDALPKVEIDPQKFEQIVVNFLSNARYAVQRKKEYASSMYNMEVWIRLFESQNQKYVIFEVEDNGNGMTDDEKQRCLEPFYTTKKVGEGTGLGLSIVHGIVHEFNMQLEIESVKDEMTVMRVLIPAQPR